MINSYRRIEKQLVIAVLVPRRIEMSICPLSPRRGSASGGNFTSQAWNFPRCTVFNAVAVLAGRLIDQPAEYLMATDKTFNVLLVENEPIVRIGVADFICGQGYTISEAGSGDRAIGPVDAPRR
jgi:hypothetical protein